MKILFLISLFLILVSCGIDKESAPPLASSSNTGELDTSFFSNGYLTLDGSAGGTSSDDEIFDVVTDSIGRIIAVGASTNASGDKDMTIWRLNSGGTLDSSFGTNGVFVHDNAAGGTGNDIGYSVTLNASDEIYVTGTSLNAGGNFDMVVWKLSASGTLDTGFSGDGVFVHDNAAGGGVHDQGNAIAIDSSQRVIVTGFSDQTVANRDLAIWKITTAGNLDTSFDGDGIFTDDGPAGGEDENGEAVLIDSANNIIVFGRADSAASLGDMAIWKLDSSGTPDNSFSGDGFFSHNNAAGGDGFDSANDAAFNSEGDYIVTGYSRNTAGNNDMVIWKVTPAGILDTSFDSDGIVVFDVSSIVGSATNDTGEGLYIDSADNIIVAGSGNDDMCIWRYDSTGTLDPNFNTDGFFSHDSAAGGFDIDAGMAVSEDSQNRLYIGGFSENSSNDFDASFWRLK